MVMVDTPFVEELSGMAMVKILDMKDQTTNMIKLKFIWNKVVLMLGSSKCEVMSVLDLKDAFIPCH